MSHPTPARHMTWRTHLRRPHHNQTPPWYSQAKPPSSVEITRFPYIRISSRTEAISHTEALVEAGHLRKNHRTPRIPTLCSSHSRVRHTRLLHQQLLSGTCQWQTSTTRLAVIRAITGRMRRVNHHPVPTVKTTVRRMKARRAHSLTINLVKKLYNIMAHSTEDSLKVPPSNSTCQ